MRDNKRLPGQSLLDFLWVNYGNRLVTSNETGDSDDIPSYGLLLQLLSNLCQKTIGSITKEGNTLIIKSAEGNEINRIDLGESNILISGFGRRLIVQEDIENGSPYSLYSPIYYIRLSNDIEFVAPIDVYKGGSKNIISNTILDNTIYSDFKISSKVQGVIFSEEEDGLSGSVYLENSEKGIRFSIVTKDEYDIINHDSTTLYFIKDEPLLFFGDLLLTNEGSIDTEKIEERLSNIENLINWEENG